jgi:hypothetical protein
MTEPKVANDLPLRHQVALVIELGFRYNLLR